MFALVLVARDTGFVVQVHGSCFGGFSHIINLLLTKLARSKWLDIGQVLFLRVYGPRPVILTSRLVNNPYIKHNSNVVLYYYDLVESL